MGDIDYSTSSTIRTFRLEYAIFPSSNNQTFKNVITTTSTNSITVDFDIETVGSGASFGISKSALMMPDVMYTLVFKIKILQKPEGIIIAGGRRASTTLLTVYENNTLIDENTYYYTCIAKNSSSTNGLFSPACAVSTTKTGHYKIQFYDCAVYEGQFKNPLMSTSLDVKSSNQFMLSDMERKKEEFFSNSLGQISLLYLYPIIDFHKIFNTSYKTFRKFYIMAIGSSSKKIKIFLFSKLVSNAASCLFNLTCTLKASSANITQIASTFVQTIGWRASGTTSILNIVNNRTSFFTGSSPISVTFEIEHIADTQYSNVFAIIDPSNSGSDAVPSLFIEMDDPMTQGDVSWNTQSPSNKIVEVS